MAVAIKEYVKYLTELKTKNNYLIIDSIKNILNKTHEIYIINTDICVEFVYHAEKTKQKLKKIVEELNKLDMDYKLKFYFVHEKLSDQILKYETKDIESVTKIIDCNLLILEFNIKKNSLLFLRYELMVLGMEKIFNAEEKIGNQQQMATIMDNIIRRNKYMLVFGKDIGPVAKLLKKYNFNHHFDGHRICIDFV